MSENHRGKNTPNEVSDEELMRLYRDQGSEDAFAVLYKRHSGRIYAYASSRLFQRHEVDELHQAIFLKFHQSRKLYDDQYSVLQWLFVIARTSILDHLRKGQRSIALSDEALPETAADVIAPDTSNDISPLDSLSEKERALVQMRVFDELSYQEISKKLGQSEPSIRQTVSRALRKLKVLVEAKGSAP